MTDPQPEVYQPLTLDDFRKETLKFRDRFQNTSFSLKNLRGAFRAYCLAYFAIEQTSIEAAADIFFSTSNEFNLRMIILHGEAP